MKRIVIALAVAAIVGRATPIAATTPPTEPTTTSTVAPTPSTLPLIPPATGCWDPTVSFEDCEPPTTAPTPAPVPRPAPQLPATR